jgi:predicted RNA binding protein YcfA (HicA-like mRNA interferase family)
VSSALPVVSGREAVRALGRAGFGQVGQKGSHVKLRNEAGRTVIVPLHRELLVAPVLDSPSGRIAGRRVS